MAGVLAVIPAKAEIHNALTEHERRGRTAAGTAQACVHRIPEAPKHDRSTHDPCTRHRRLQRCPGHRGARRSGRPGRRRDAPRHPRERQGDDGRAVTARRDRQIGPGRGRRHGVGRGAAGNGRSRRRFDRARCGRAERQHRGLRRRSARRSAGSGVPGRRTGDVRGHRDRRRGARGRTRWLHHGLPRRRPRTAHGAGRAVSHPRRRVPQRRVHPVKGVAPRRVGHRRGGGNGRARYRVRGAVGRSREARRLEEPGGRAPDRRSRRAREAAQGSCRAGRRNVLVAAPPERRDRRCRDRNPHSNVRSSRPDRRRPRSPGFPTTTRV